MTSGICRIVCSVISELGAQVQCIVCFIDREGLQFLSGSITQT